MAYEIKFTAYDDADWAEAIELIDDDTGLALDDATDAVFELDVTDDCGTSVLSASTTEGTITKPEDNVIAWRFAEDDMGSLCAGRTYNIGCRMTVNDGSEMLFTGTLTFLDGGMA